MPIRPIKRHLDDGMENILERIQQARINLPCRAIVMSRMDNTLTLSIDTGILLQDAALCALGAGGHVIEIGHAREITVAGDPVDHARRGQLARVTMHWRDGLPEEITTIYSLLPHETVVALKNEYAPLMSKADWQLVLDMRQLGLPAQ